MVTIPACYEHEGIHATRVVLPWVCPVCGGERGEPHPAISYDGSRRLGCDGWDNPCGHVDKYADVREEFEAFRQTAEGQIAIQGFQTHYERLHKPQD